MRVGALRIPHGTYLLAAAILVRIGGGCGAVLFRALIGYETALAGSLTALLARLDGDRLVGIVGVATLAQRAVEPQTVLGAIAASPPPPLRPGDSLEHAADLLTDPGLVLLLVLDDDDRFVGVVSRRAVLEAYRSAREV